MSLPYLLIQLLTLNAALEPRSADLQICPYLSGVMYKDPLPYVHASHFVVGRRVTDNGDFI